MCIISLVILGGGVGDGEGLGNGDGEGDGVCAIVLSGTCVAISPAAPTAGRSLTNARRLTLVLRGDLAAFDFLFFMFLPIVALLFDDGSKRYLPDGNIVPVPTPCVISAPYLSFKTFALPKR